MSLRLLKPWGDLLHQCRCLAAQGGAFFNDLLQPGACLGENLIGFLYALAFCQLPSLGYEGLCFLPEFLAGDHFFRLCGRRCVHRWRLGKEGTAEQQAEQGEFMSHGCAPVS